MSSERNLTIFTGTAVQEHALEDFRMTGDMDFVMEQLEDRFGENIPTRATVYLWLRKHPEVLKEGRAEARFRVHEKWRKAEEESLDKARKANAEGRAKDVRDLTLSAGIAADHAMTYDVLEDSQEQPTSQRPPRLAQHQPTVEVLPPREEDDGD